MSTTNIAVALTAVTIYFEDLTLRAAASLFHEQVLRNRGAKDLLEVPKELRAAVRSVDEEWALPGKPYNYGVRACLAAGEPQRYDTSHLPCGHQDAAGEEYDWAVARYRVARQYGREIVQAARGITEWNKPNR